jgi:WD40 repeat protein
MRSSIAISILCVVVLLPCVCLGQISKSNVSNQLKIDSEVTHLEVDIRGNVYYTSSGGETLTKWDREGKITVVGGNSSSAGRVKLGRISDVAITNGLKIYLADRRNFAIQIFEKHLEWIGSLSPEAQDLEYSEPELIAVSQQDAVFAYYSDKHKLVKFNSDGNQEPGFVLPIDITRKIIDISTSNDSVFLLDENDVIHLLSLNGRYQKFVKSDQKYIQLARFFNRMLLISVDQVGLLSENGTFVAQWKINDSNIAQLNVNGGWAVWRKDNLLVREKIADPGELSVLSRIE